jgi:2-methylcitrate dehydratase PrpD
VTNLTQHLAEFVADTTWADLPASARERAAVVLVDTVASAYAGHRSDEAKQIEALAEAVAGAGASPVVGRASRSAAGAVLVNGYLITATTVCDVHKATLCHVTPEVFPPAVAVGVDRRVTGRDFLLAFALGLEITTRVGLGSDYPAFRSRGWHSPGVWGPFGGAAAAGKLMGLDSRRQCNAFGLAGSQAAGTFAHWGTPTIKFHQSRGALSGFLAASLAETGFEAAADVLTATDGGLYGTYSNGGDAGVALADLGSRWELERLSLRPWPLASSLQSVATALLSLISTHGVAAADVAQARVGLSETVHGMHGTLPWNDRFQALLSAPYVTAVILADQVCWLEQFTPERIADPRLDAFARDNVTVRIDDSVTGTGAVVELELANGEVLTERRDIPHGDPDDPLTMGDVRRKFVGATAGVMSEDEASAMVDRLAAIDQADVVTSALFGGIE